MTETAPHRPRVGVLALQGDFALHRRALEAVGGEVMDVRDPEDLHGLDGLVLPGGETTTMLRLMDGTAMEEAIRGFVRDGGAVFGTCAGLILLARRVSHPDQRALGILDAEVERNAYGRQIDSFETDLPWTEDTDRIRGVFIRAPRIREVGSGVRVLAAVEGEPVLIREGRVLAATFHPELTDDTRVHRYFLEQVLNGARRTAGAEPTGTTA